MMSSPAEIRSRLEAAAASQRLVRLERVSRPGQSIDGFVIGVGAKWVLLARIMAGGYFDGVTAVRSREISRVRHDRSFESRSASVQPEWPPQAPSGVEPSDLDTTAGMLAALLRPGVLASIERDRRHDSLWVGVPNELVGRWLYLSEVRPDGTWHERPFGYRFRTITVVTVDDHYLRGLALVAGEPPVEELPHHWTARGWTRVRSDAQS